jgi:hypothetical protein
MKVLRYGGHRSLLHSAARAAAYNGDGLLQVPYAAASI